mgnify:CR=1 FL=1
MNTKKTADSNKSTASLKETRTERTIRAIMSLDCDPKQQKRKEFEKYYPAVLHALSRKVPRKTILKHLNEGGLKLYPSLFEEFMGDLNAKCQSAGNALSCEACGQPLSLQVPAHLPSESGVSGEGSQRASDGRVLNQETAP